MGVAEGSRVASRPQVAVGAGAASTGDGDDDDDLVLVSLGTPRGGGVRTSNGAEAGGAAQGDAGFGAKCMAAGAAGSLRGSSRTATSESGRVDAAATTSTEAAVAGSPPAAATAAEAAAQVERAVREGQVDLRQALKLAQRAALVCAFSAPHLADTMQQLQLQLQRLLGNGCNSSCCCGGSSFIPLPSLELSSALVSDAVAVQLGVSLPLPSSQRLGLAACACDSRGARLPSSAADPCSAASAAGDNAVDGCQCVASPWAAEGSEPEVEPFDVEWDASLLAMPELLPFAGAPGKGTATGRCGGGTATDSASSPSERAAPMSLAQLQSHRHASWKALAPRCQDWLEQAVLAISSALVNLQAATAAYAAAVASSGPDAASATAAESGVVALLGAAGGLQSQLVAHLTFARGLRDAVLADCQAAESRTGGATAGVPSV